MTSHLRRADDLVFFAIRVPSFQCARMIGERAQLEWARRSGDDRPQPPGVFMVAPAAGWSSDVGAAERRPKVVLS
jgi:hypothetical protein